MNHYDFITDPESQAFCDLIASRMVQQFGITTAEAVGRINRQWRGMSFLGAEELIYHEAPDFWVNTIYYGPSSSWWIELPEKPLPYP